MSVKVREVRDSLKQHRPVIVAEEPGRVGGPYRALCSCCTRRASASVATDRLHAGVLATVVDAHNVWVEHFIAEMLKEKRR